MLVIAFVLSLGIVGTFYILCEEGYLVANMRAIERVVLCGGKRATLIKRLWRGGFCIFNTKNGRLKVQNHD